MGLDPFAFRAERLHVIRLEHVEIATNKAAEMAKSRPWISHLSRQSYIAQLHAGHRDKASEPASQPLGLARLSLNFRTLIRCRWCTTSEPGCVWDHGYRHNVL